MGEWPTTDTSIHTCLLLAIWISGIILGIQLERWRTESEAQNDE